MSYITYVYVMVLHVIAMFCIESNWMGCWLSWVVDDMSLLLISRFIKLMILNITLCVFDKPVYYLGKIDAYSGDAFLYWSGVRLCIRSLRVYRDDILFRRETIFFSQLQLRLSAKLMSQPLTFSHLRKLVIILATSERQLFCSSVFLC